jgi:hypothetical protein
VTREAAPAQAPSPELVLKREFVRGMGADGPLSSEGGSPRRASVDNANVPVCRSFSSAWSRNECLEHIQRVSRDVARARECSPVPKCTRLVPARNRNLAFAGNTICLFAGLLCKPSDGLEPATPSLPWISGVVAGGPPRWQELAR